MGVTGKDRPTKASALRTCEEGGRRQWRSGPPRWVADPWLRSLAARAPDGAGQLLAAHVVDGADHLTVAAVPRRLAGRDGEDGERRLGVGRADVGLELLEAAVPGELGDLLVARVGGPAGGVEQ